uniref:Profilin-6 n=1 Tax=Rhizophora mucronata TaxID=61149 RepID=A0A2P2K1F8_RHIMU
MRNIDTCKLRKQGRNQEERKIEPTEKAKKKKKTKRRKPTLSVLMLLFQQDQTRNKQLVTATLHCGLQALINEVITQPFHDHIALPWSQRFVVYPKNKSLTGLLHSDATGTLLSTDHSSRFALDHHVLGATKVQPSWSKGSRFIKIFHDGRNLIRLKLREAGALSPDATVVADDGGSRETVAVDVAHEVVVDVRLPRHSQRRLRLTNPSR